MARKWATAKSFASLMPESDAIVTATDEHFYNHEGNYFTATHNIPSLAPEAVYYIGFITGDSPLHIFPLNIDSNISLLEYSFFEDADFSGGAPKTVLNKNRMINKPSESQFILAPTVVTEGVTLLDIVLIGSEGVGQRRTGGSISTQAPWIFKPNTKYLAKFTNKNSVAGMIQVISSWYQEVLE